MGNKVKYPVVLGKQDIAVLEEYCRKGVHSARTIKRCRILLAIHEGLEDQEICEREKVGRTTPLEIRKRFCAGGIERAIHDAPRPGQPPRLSESETVQVTAIACSDPPDGHARWTVRLITAEYNRRFGQTGKTVSRTTINRVLLDNSIKPWREKNVVRSKT